MSFPLLWEATCASFLFGDCCLVKETFIVPRQRCSSVNALCIKPGKWKIVLCSLINACPSVAERGWYYSVNNYLKDGRPVDGSPVMLTVWPVEEQQAQHVAQDTALRCPTASLTEENLKHVTRYLMLFIWCWLPASFLQSPSASWSDSSFNLGWKPPSFTLLEN